MKELVLSINNTPIPVPSTIQHLSGGLSTTGQKVIQLGTSILLLASVLISLFFLIISGIKIITSGGDKQQLANARSSLLYSMIGLVISLMAFLFINVFGEFFGIQLLGS